MKDQNLKKLRDYLSEEFAGKEVYENGARKGKLKAVRVKDGGQMYLDFGEGELYPVTHPDRIRILNGSTDALSEKSKLNVRLKGALLDSEIFEDNTRFGMVVEDAYVDLHDGLFYFNVEGRPYLVIWPDSIGIRKGSPNPDEKKN